MAMNHKKEPFHYSNGYIYAIVGPVRSGKSEELIRIAKRLDLLKREYCIVKPSFDNRDKNEIVSYFKEEKTVFTKNVIVVETIEDLLFKAGVNNFTTFLFDEIQFLNISFVDIINDMANSGKNIYAAGLDMNWKGIPFETTSNILSICDHVKKVVSVCDKCFSNTATRTFKKVEGDDIFLTGGPESYEPRCRKCWKEGMIERRNERQTK